MYIFFFVFFFSLRGVGAAMSNPAEGKDAKEKQNVAKAARIAGEGRTRKPWNCSRLVSAVVWSC